MCDGRNKLTTKYTRGAVTKQTVKTENIGVRLDAIVPLCSEIELATHSFRVKNPFV